MGNDIRNHPSRAPLMQEKQPYEPHSLLKDTADYGWYTTMIELGLKNLPWRKFVISILQVASLGHALHAFVNEELADTLLLDRLRSDHGSRDEKNFVLKKPIKLKIGVNHIALLRNLVGLPNSVVHLERGLAGVHDVQIQGLNTRTNGSHTQRLAWMERECLFLQKKNDRKLSGRKPDPKRLLRRARLLENVLRTADVES
ncbi:hypothetical protein RJ641_013981 [Dillenia turbinata]|uniref:Uncharacterized protein n=1 Tax=Dillenia turbinata TaxID=194707 RepID=A0AAN8WI32_9MAGN